MIEPPEILLEDNHCLALCKPPGVPSAHFDGKHETMDQWAKAYLKRQYQKPGNVFLGVVHRLDKPVSGVLLFARTTKAASRLSEQFRDGSVEKIYWAVIEGKMPTMAGTLEDWLCKDEAKETVDIVTRDTPGARQALLHYETRAEANGLTLLELRPQTGRRHQLRVQLAHRGRPVYGDAKYGSIRQLGSAIGLHARLLAFMHPVKNELTTVRANVPEAWLRRFASLLQGLVS